MTGDRPAAREGFGEANLGDAQSSEPKRDPEMIEGEDGRIDQDAESPAAPEEAEQDSERDQAEG